MQKFRFTIIAICLLLIYLAWDDIRIVMRNFHPESISAYELYFDGPTREWLSIQGGYLNLEKAISTSGTIELDALVVPLMPKPQDDGEIRVLVETRDETLLHHFAQYHFRSPTLEEKERYLSAHREAFHPQVDIVGLVGTGNVTKSNRNKILQIAHNANLHIHPEVIYISEGNTPPRYRGLFFMVVGVLGIVRVLSVWKRRPPAASGGQLA